MSPSITQLLIVLVIVILLFGTKKLRSLGGDLGSAIRSFRSAVKDGEKEGEKKDAVQLDQKDKPAESQTEAEKEKQKNNA